MTAYLRELRKYKMNSWNMHPKLNMSVLVNTVFCFFDCGFVCLLKIMFFLSKFTGHMN